MIQPVNASIRIALADDQALVREGLKALLRAFGIETVLEACEGEALLRGLTHPPVVLLTTFDDTELLPAAIEAGAQGFLLKDASPEDLRDAILRAHRGEEWLSPVAIRTRKLRAACSSPKVP